MKTYIDFLAEMGVDGAHPGGLQLTREILRKLNINRHSCILDAGCGTGETAAYLARQFRANVTAIDNHPVMIEKAKQRFLRLKLPIHLIHCSVESLPFPKEKFDFILCESVLSFVNLPNTLKEMRRVLKTNGLLIAIEATKNNKLANKDEQLIKKFYGFKNLYLEQEWTTHFRKNGLQVIRILQPYDPRMEIKQVPISNKTDIFNAGRTHDDMNAIWQHHEYLTMKYRDQLGYRVYFCKK